jgi:hypothetical protein
MMYADDLILMSASVLDLQIMLNICNDVADDLCLKFNASKCKCLQIGPVPVTNLPIMTIGEQISIGPHKQSI